MKIGIIGTGKLGSVLGQLFVKSMHKVMFASSDPESLHAFTEAVGANASYGSWKETFQYADVQVLTLPFVDIPNLADEIETCAKGKVIIDATTPCKAGERILEQYGFDLRQSNRFLKQLFSDSYIAKAFYQYNGEDLKKLANPSLTETKIPMPFTCEHPDVKQIVENLIGHIGFKPEFENNPYTISFVKERLRKAVGSP